MCQKHEKTTKHESCTWFLLKKGKAISLDASRGPEFSRSLRLPYFKTAGT